MSEHITGPQRFALLQLFNEVFRQPASYFPSLANSDWEQLTKLRTRLASRGKRSASVSPTIPPMKEPTNVDSC